MQNIHTDAGDTGTNSRVDMYVGMIRDLSRKHRLKPFKLVTFYSELDKADLRRRMERGDVVEGLDHRPAFTFEDLDRTDRVVAMAGVHPFIRALEADVAGHVVPVGLHRRLLPTLHHQ